MQSLTVGMTEPLAYFGLGFLVAALSAGIVTPSLFKLAIRPAAWRRNAVTKLIAKLRADKNKLRAELARSTRSSEIIVEELKGKIAGQRADLGKMKDAINHLKLERNLLKME